MVILVPRGEWDQLRDSNSGSIIGRTRCRFDRTRVERAKVQIRELSSTESTSIYTYEGKVLGFPDIVVIDGGENDPKRNTSDSAN